MIQEKKWEDMKMIDNNLRASWVTPVPITHISGPKENLRQEVVAELNKRAKDESSLEESLFYHKILLLLNGTELMMGPPVTDPLLWPINRSPNMVSG